MLIYVDDVLVTGPSDAEIQQLKTYLDQAFTVKDLGATRFIFGIEIARNSTGICSNQRKYILDILADLGLEGCKSALTPLPQGIQLTAVGDGLMPNPDKYGQLVGRLLYINLSRPDMSYVVQQLSQFVRMTLVQHWQAALHVVRYLKGYPSDGLLFSANCDLTLTAYCDTDRGSCVDSRCSLTGFCIFLVKSLLYWRCKKQTTVSTSSVKVKYRALSSTVRKLIWLVNLLGDFGIQVSLLIPLFCDNQAVIHITKNPEFHKSTKHLDIDSHSVHDQFKKGFVLPQFVSSSFQLADLFTKSLGGLRLRFLQDNWDGGYSLFHLGGRGVLRLVLILHCRSESLLMRMQLIFQ